MFVCQGNGVAQEKDLLVVPTAVAVMDHNLLNTKMLPKKFVVQIVGLRVAPKARVKGASHRTMTGAGSGSRS